MTPKRVAVVLLCLFAALSACTSGHRATHADRATDARSAVAESDPDASGSTCVRYAAATAAGRITDSRLVEISGIAVSRKNPGLFWVHNDSGDGPVVYAVRDDGQTLGSIRLEGATAVDWEDVAIGPCGPRTSAGDCLYIGDIGDNRRRRVESAVYRVKEPPVKTLEPFGDLHVREYDRFAFAYPRKPENAEALAVAPDGSIYILTKKEGSAGLYVFPSLLPDERPRLDFLGTVSLGKGRAAKATAFDIDPDGRRVLVRTYFNALEWRIPEGEPIAWIAGKPGTPVPTVMEPQGEAIAYDPIRGGYVHVSEGTSPSIYRVGCDDGP